MKKLYVLLTSLFIYTISFAQVPPNDDCSGALPVTLDCINGSNVTTGTTVNATTGVGLPAFCGIVGSDVGVWYEFTAVGPDIVIDDNLGSNLHAAVLSQPNCTGTIVNVGCGPTPLVLDNLLNPGDDYFIFVAFPGGAEGAFELCVNHPATLANSDPCAAEDISATGMFTGYTYGTDIGVTTPTCTNDNTQYFLYDAPNDVFKLDIELTSTEITSSVTLIVAEENPDCNNLVVVDEFCNVNLPIIASQVCIDPTVPTYLVVSTPLDNNGEFTLSVTDVLSNNCNDNDVCDAAQDLGTIASDCVTQTFSECNTDACPDNAILGQCDMTLGPTVWYQFTTDAQASAVDIVLDNAFDNDLTVVLADMCDFSGTNYCTMIMGGVAELFQVTVSPNTTYYVGVTDPGSDGGTYDLNIRVYPTLLHDDPCNVVLTPGTHMLDNHCTTADAPGFISTNCPNALIESTAWYEFEVPSSEDYFTLTITNDAGDPLPGNALIQVGIRNPAGCTSNDFDALDEQCTSLNAPFEFEGYCFPEPGPTTYYILIGTQSDETGSYTVDLVYGTSVCTVNDECDDIALQHTMNPVSPPDPSTPPVEICLQGCTNYACPEPITLANCDFTLYNAVWYQVNTDNLAAIMNISIEAMGANNWTPVFAMFTGDCSNLMPVPLNGNPDDCLIATGTTLNIPQVTVASDETYYLLIGSETGQGGEFEVCVSTEVTLEACINDHSLEVVDREHNLPLTDPFCPGELITFDYSVEYRVDPQGTGNGCQWLQGVIPNFGEGWDIDGFVPTTIPGGIWGWYDEGEVDYNWDNFRYSIYTEGGRIKIAHYTTYPDNYDINNAFAPGTLLPEGWYAVSDAGGPGPGGTCVVGSQDPDETYGAPAGCGSVYPLSFEFSIRVKEDCMPGDDLDIAIFEFADGSIGCWDQQVCALDGAVVFDNGIVECLGGHVRDSTYEICSGDLTDIILDAGDPTSSITYMPINNPNIIGAMSGSGSNGMATIVDQLENTSSCVTEEIVYQVFVSGSAAAICPPDTAEITVIVYSEIEINQPTPEPFFCADEQVVINLADYVCGGTGNYTYMWSDNRGNNGTDPNIMAAYDPGQVVFNLDVEDDLGCVMNGQITVMVNDELNVVINGIDLVCEYETPVELTASATGGTGVYTEYNWQLPGGGSIVGPDSVIDADETGLYLLTVTDDEGCEAFADFNLTVIPRPDYTLTVVPNNAAACANGVPVFVNVSVGIPVDISWVTPPAFPDNLDGQSSFDTNIPGTYIFTIEDANGCINQDSIVVTIEDPPMTNSDTLTSCDDGSGTAVFDLTLAEGQVTGGANVTLIWYEDDMGMVEITDPMNYVSGPDSVFAIVTDPMTNCLSDPTPVYLEFLSTFTANDAAQVRCLELGGFGSFNLDDLVNTISGGNGTVEFYGDTTLMTPITQTSDFETGDTIVYAIIRDASNCISNIADVVLTTDTLLEAFPASLDACEMLDGTATYDLTQANNDVTNGQSLTVIYFEDVNGNTEITDPANFNTNAAQVYATVSDGTCAANISVIDLTTFTTGPTPSDTLDACDEGGVGTFDLESNGNPIVSGGNPGTVFWYENSDRTGAINNPSNFTTGNSSVFVIFEDENGCISDLTEFFLSIGPIIAEQPDPLSECGVGTATFDLTIRDVQVTGGNAGRTVVWYEDMALTNEIMSPNAYDSGTGTVYAVAVEGPCQSAPVALDLTVSVDLPANPAALDACIRANGMGVFNLNDANNTVNSNPSFVIRYYTDTTDLTDSLTGVTLYETDMATLFAVVFDGSCRSFAQPITLTTSIQNFPNQGVSIPECDEGSGMSTFDLTQFDDDVSGNMTSTVEWFEDAGGTQPIATPTAFSSSAGVVYARVTDEDGCISDLVEVSLEVTIVLVAEDANISTCDEGGGVGTFDLTSYELTIQGNIGTRMVLWYTDTTGAPLTGTDMYVANDGDVIFAIVTDGRCVSAARAYTLSVVNNLPANSASAVACDENGMGTFNLLSIEDDILGGNNFTVEFYTDMALTNPITGDLSAYVSGPTTIYAITIDGNCRSLPVEIQLSLIPEIVANPASEEQCDDGSGSAVFDLTTLEATIDGGQGFDVLWYEDAALTMPINDPTQYVSDGTNVYAVLTNGSCDSAPVEIDLEVTVLAGNAAEGFACDEGNNTGTFDLQGLEPSVISDAGQTVTWYEDAALTIVIDASQPYGSGGGIIYAVVSDGTCSSQAVEVTLTLTDKLPADATQSEQCDDGDGSVVFDLSALEAAINTNGSGSVVWSTDDMGTNIITNVTNFESGSATIYAQVVDGSCRSDIIPIQLIVNELPATDAGMDQVLDCRSDFLTITGQGPTGDYTYAWTTNDGNIVSGADALSMQADQPGTYTLEIINNATGCSQTDAMVVTEDVNVPVADAGPDAAIDCIQSTTDIGTNNTTTGADIVITWRLNGAELPENTPIITVGNPGTYALHVENTSSGCENTDTVLVTSLVDQLTDIETTILNPNCTGANTGCITVTGVTGGQSPYSYSINNQDFVSESEFCDLGPGTYLITVMDINGCSVSENVVVEQPEVLIVEIQGETTIDYGDSTTLVATHSPEEVVITNYEWATDSVFNSSTDNIVVVSGLNDFTVSVTVIDENGCTATDQVAIYVLKNFKVFAPTAFSPINDDNINDRFFLFGDENIVSSVDELRIFSRWGAKVYERTNLRITDYDEGWDGTFKGEFMNPGVYIYYATVTFTDGSTRQIQGEVHLLD